MSFIVICDKRSVFYAFSKNKVWLLSFALAFLFSQSSTQCYGASNQFNIQFSDRSKTSYLIPGSESIKPSRMQEGKIYIRRIQFQGDLFVRELGVNEDFVMNSVMDSLKDKTNYLSIADLHELADNLTIAYREFGLSFYQAFVVPQEIVNETVHIVVQPGKLSQIIIYGNEHYSNQQLQDPFKKLIGRRLYEPEIKQAMAELNRYPGLRVFGYFSMGLEDGETRLNLKVMEEDISDMGFVVDNYGLEDTGKMRGSFFYSVNNLFSRKDVINLTLLSTEQDGNISGAISYQQPISFDDWISFRFQSNNFDVKGDFEALGISGTLNKFSAGITHLSQSTNRQSTSYSAAVSYKDSIVESKIFNEFIGYDTKFITLEAGISRTRILGNQDRWIRYNIVPILGIIESSNNVDLEDNFYSLKGFADYHSRWPEHIKFLDSYTIELEAMYSSSRIPASERRSLTGPYSTRVLPPATFIGDNIFTVRGSQYLPQPDLLPKDWNFNPFVFLDYGFASSNAADSTWMEVAGYGVGLDLGYSKSINAQVTWGKPFYQKQSDSLFENKENNVIYAKFIIRF